MKTPTTNQEPSPAFGLSRVRLDRPYGCKCQSMASRILGDGCDECNHKLAEEIRRENEAQLEEDKRAESAERMASVQSLLTLNTPAHPRS